MGGLRYQPQGLARIDRGNPLGARVIESIPLNGQLKTVVEGRQISIGPGGAMQGGPRGLHLRGAGPGARASVPLDLSRYSAITIAFWMCWDAYANDDAFAIEFTPNTNYSAGGFYIDPNSPGAFAIVSNGNGFRGTGSTYPRPTAAAWHRIAVSINIVDQRAALYVDGVLQAPTWMAESPGAGSSFANSTLNLFSRNGSDLLGTGRMQDIAIYNGVLSPTEVAQDYVNPWQIYDDGRGNDADFIAPAPMQRALPVAAGALGLGFGVVGLRSTRRAPSVAGALSLAGAVVGLPVTRHLRASPTALVFDVGVASLFAAHRLSGSAAGCVASGLPASLRSARRLHGASSALWLASGGIHLMRSDAQRALNASPEVLSVAGVDANFLLRRDLSMFNGAFASTVSAADLRVARRMGASPDILLMATGGMSPYVQWRVSAETARIATPSGAAQLRYSAQIDYTRAPTGPGYTPQRHYNESRPAATSSPRPGATQRNFR